MKNFKKLFCLLLSAVIVFSLISVFADDVTDKNITLPIITVSENATSDEINDAIIKAKSEYPEIYNTYEVEPRAGLFKISPVVIRSGNTARCELYFNWECTGDKQYMISEIAFDLLKITNGGIGPFELVYSNIGGSWLPCETGSTGSVRVISMTIPTDQKVVYAKDTGLKALILPDGKWYSTLLSYGKITIK